MMGNEEFQVVSKVRKHFLKYTRQAFQVLPYMNKPRILDIGCGTGIPTLELAGLSQGDVTGIDIDEPAIDRFNRRIEEAGLSDRVQAIHVSMFDMAFADESFDIIWSEGAIFAIGFERGLREWGRWLKPDGFMVVHDERGDIEEKLGKIPLCGYELLDYFTLSQETWWNEYYIPLEKLVTEYRTQHIGDTDTSSELAQAETELSMFRKSPERNNSVYFIMQKH